MRKWGLIILVALNLLCLPVLLMAQTPTLSSPGPGQIPVKSVPLGASPVLWDQPLSGSNHDAYTCQDFEDMPEVSIFAADDFFADAPWFVQVIYVPGDLWNGGTSIMNATKP